MCVLLIFIDKPKAANLNCVLKGFYTISCNWSDPMLISEFNITNYEILVNSVAKENITAALNYSYNATTFGEHRIDVVPYIQELKGETSNLTLNVSGGK